MSNQIDTPKNSSLGTYLKRKRVERGLTQSEVASKLGYGSPQFISNIERGISSVPLKSLKVIIDLYQLPADEVLEVLVSEKKNYWREQLGIGSESGTRAEMMPKEDFEDREQEDKEETPILYSSNQDRPPETNM